MGREWAASLRWNRLTFFGTVMIMRGMKEVVEIGGIAAELISPETLRLSLKGRLDSQTTGAVWRSAQHYLSIYHHPQNLIVDAGGVTYCDVTGIGLILELQHQQEKRKASFELQNLAQRFERLRSLFSVNLFAETHAPRPRRMVTIATQFGRVAATLASDLYQQVVFTGEMTAALLYAARHPSKARWKEVFYIMETAGVNALPIIAMLSFLMGLIMAFQAAVPMTQLGANIFVANLVALALTREMAALLVAIVLAGRSGSSFAAELGTMKVDDELNALATMGLNPVRYLAMPRVVAAVMVTPMLTVFANLFGLIGGALVVMSLGYPLVTYINRVTAAVQMKALMGGLFKSAVFGALVAGIGCLRGLQTNYGAQAVGISTTRAVVSGIVLIVAADGFFSLIFYYLKI